MKNKYIKVRSELKPTGIVKCIKRNAKTGEIISTNIYENLICNTWKNVTAARYAGDGNACDITYGAVGTDNTTPVSTDTTLGAELARKTVIASSSANVVTIIVFFGASDGNGTLEEFGLFGQGASASADSGEMVNHVLISETKTSVETLTFEVDITIN